MEQENRIVFLIKDIDNPGLTLSESGYGKWMIAFTSQEIYFIKMSSSSSVNPVGILTGGVGLLVQAGIKKILSTDEKIDLNNLSSILNNSKKHYTFTRNNLNQIECKKGFLNQSVILHSVEKNDLNIALNKKNYQIFIEQLDQFKK